MCENCEKAKKLDDMASDLREATWRAYREALDNCKDKKFGKVKP